MKLQFEKFYYQFGLRRLGEFISPKVFPLKGLSQYAVLHSLTDDTALVPDVSSPLLGLGGIKVMMKNVFTLTPENQSVGKYSMQVDPKVSEFMRDNKGFGRLLKPLTEVTDKNQLVVVNYNLLKGVAKYSPSDKLGAWKSWFDFHKTMWESVDDLCGIPRFQHYFEVKVTQDLPALSAVRKHLVANSGVMLQDMNTSGRLFLLDLFRFIDPETRSMSSLSVIKPEHYKKINFIFRIDDGRSVIVNLGYINSWINEQPNQTEFSRVSQIMPMQMCGMILKLNIGLQNLAIEQEASVREAEESKEDDGQSLEEGYGGDPTDSLEYGAVKKSGQQDKKGDPSSKAAVGQSNTKSSGEGVSLSASKQEESDNLGVEDIDSVLKAGDESLAALEEMESRRKRLRGTVSEDDETEPEYDPSETVTVEEVTAKVFENKSDVDRLVGKLDDLVANNRISAADYRKIQKTINEQPDKPNPYNGKGTLREATTIHESERKLKPGEADMKIDARVIDKSIASCSIEPLTRNYVTKTLRKHTLKAILGIQSSGVVVTNIDTEVHQNVMGAYERHAITLKPLEGQSSTIYVRVPVVEADGTFKSNGVKYYVRTQRTDLPIRKIAPDRVSLASFMTKMFVYRSPKKSDSALASVVKYLTLGTIGGADNLLEVKPANVYDNKFQCPFILSALSAHFKSFKVSNAVFGELSFDMGLKEKVKGDYWKVGVNKKGRDILVGMDNNFHIATENGDQPLGDIFDILEMDRLRAPVDFAVTKTMGKLVPVGLILARAIGLRPLLKLLNVKFRTVKTRGQKNLEPHEYFITFADHVFIFDRRDTKASLILASFQTCEKVTRQFKAEVFDQKEVYDNLFDTFGCTAAFSRELALLESSFVDPITQDVLIEMKEPVTWLGLLVRSCEMLEAYDHPNVQDLSQQQFRGFERFPGFIYKEMITSVRAFRNKNVSGRSKVEMSPFAVWSAIRSDPTVSTSQDINPIQNLKSHEAVTFVGEGGRSKDAFMKDSRAYDEADAGVISEASVDSGDVGINIFMCGNPKIDNMFGMKKKGPVESEAGNYLSSSLMLAAGSQHDD